jgi:tRNA-splicing ligase RtcB
MVRLQDLQQINRFEWEIPKSYREDMRVAVHIFATRQLLEQIKDDKSLEQATNAATLPGLVGRVVVMPDVHQGYGFPIGGVAATRLPHGVISPGAIGYDINCGVRLMASQIEFEAVKKDLSDLADSLNRLCPSGVGKKGHLRLKIGELEKVCKDGSRWTLQHGYATEADLRRTEENGCLEGGDPTKISKRAKERGRPQLGTLGAGNHFIEVDVVDQIFHQDAAQVMGLIEGYLVVMIHCGSRGFGHQICTDYVREFQAAVKRYGIRLPDRELVCAPLDSPEGQAYLGAMRGAANYAFANRQVLAHFARQAFEETLAGKVPNWHLHQVYDIAHNMGKIETHEVDGKPIEVCIHRKGATRAFGPAESMKRSFGSSCHGAGRTMSRSKAKKMVWGEDLRKELQAQGIHIRAGSMAGLAEEAPQAYKDVDAVVETVAGAGIAQKVARLRPVAVIKG